MLRKGADLSRQIFAAQICLLQFQSQTIFNLHNTQYKYVASISSNRCPVISSGDDEADSKTDR